MSKYSEEQLERLQQKHNKRMKNNKSYKKSQCITIHNYRKDEFNEFRSVKNIKKMRLK